MKASNFNQVVKILILILVTIGCQNFNNSKTENSSRKEDLISIDSINFEKYPDLMELRTWLRDTITKSNWNVEYLVKNDSTIDTDIYIRISKGRFENIYKGEKLLQFRRYFIPAYLSESDNEIIMQHDGCTTGCSMITFISKRNPTLTETYNHVLDFNEDKNIIIFITDSTYGNEDEFFEIEIMNFKTDKVSNLKLGGICTSVFKSSCIDTIIYKADEIEIVTVLRDDIEKVEKTKKRHLVAM